MRSFALFFMFVVMAFPAHALSIDHVRFGAYTEKTRLVLELSEQTDFRAFVLDSPYRLVIDFPQLDWKAGEFKKPPSAGMKAVRSGILKPGVSRLVFDLNGPIGIRSAFLLPKEAGKPDRFVLDYIPTAPSAFALEKKKILGTLNPDKVYASAKPLQPTAPPPPKARPAAQKPLIVIDPGHGGVDPGAVASNGRKEKDVVLKLAQNLRMKLNATGRYRVLLTRDDDRFIKLSQRRKFARDKGADLFISIHADSIDKHNVRGASVYTLSEKASDKQSARLAARENKADLIGGIDLSVEDEEVASILVDLAMRDTTNQAKFLANNVVSKFQTLGLRVLENPHRYAGFAVLKAPDVPSILVEAGFMSNSKEANLLNTPAHRSKIAKALTKGIDAYFEQVKKNQRI